MSKLLFVSVLLAVVLCSLPVTYAGFLGASDGNTTTVVNCTVCALDQGCFWCSSLSSCLCGSDFLLNNDTCTDGWCSGASCVCEEPCSNGFWPCSESTAGQLILMVFYGLVLAGGAKLISDGSELLMEILNPGIIGGLVLPVLGAFPDAMIIIISGALGSRAEAQAQVAVGVGTLAGSTIMLLTIPWSAAMVLARCDIRGGEAVDNVLTNPKSITENGITVDDDTPINAKIMMATSLSYLIVQGIAFAYLKDPATGEHVERYFALVAFLVCFGCLVAYCIYQVVSPTLQEKKMEEARRKHTMQVAINNLLHRLESMKHMQAHEASPLLSNEPAPVPKADARAIGLKWKVNAQKAEAAAAATETPKRINDDEEAGEGEKHESTPAQIAMQAAALLTVGTILVSVFSDPMVEVISDFGTKHNIKLFFISFIVTPFCSNASELISSLIFASSKKRKNTSLTYSALYGAATMNNTLCLGIFFALVCFRELTWEFSAETIAILFVTMCVGVVGARKTTIPTYYAPLILGLYPMSLFIVWLLESFAHWQ